GIDGDTFYRLDRIGTVLDTLVVTKSGSGPELVDLDISATGHLLATDRFGEVFLTDTSFSSVSQFNIEITGASNYFAAFASPVTAIPEPSSVVALGLLAAGIVQRRSRRRRR
ncbi:MAG: PEP-CTERM sorting domain-containing protein, partial [Planctomycetota bacterium]